MKIIDKLFVILAVASCIFSFTCHTVGAFEFGKFKADSEVSIYAPDGVIGSWALDNQIGSNTRLEAATSLSFSDYSPRFNIYYRGDTDEDMSRVELYNLKADLEMPIWKSLSGVLQYEETNDPGQYEQNARAGVRMRF